MDRDDTLTVAAIGVAAAMLACIGHEALGHGGACLAIGGQVTRLTTVYFNCSKGGDWVAIWGPLANLIGAGVGWLAFAAARPAAARLRLLALLLMAVNLFWFAGYALHAAVLKDGDPYFAWRDLVGPPGLAFQMTMVGLGLLVYAIGWRAVRPYAARPGGQRRLVIAWLAGGIAIALASLAYAPDRLASFIQGALQVGAASLPLVLVRPPVAGEADGRIGRHWPLIVAVGLGFAVFAWVLGRGLP